jgi:hypothetical protein
LTRCPYLNLYDGRGREKGGISLRAGGRFEGWFSEGDGDKPGDLTVIHFPRKKQTPEKQPKKKDRKNA